MIKFIQSAKQQSKLCQIEEVEKKLVSLGSRRIAWNESEGVSQWVSEQVREKERDREPVNVKEWSTI